MRIWIVNHYAYGPDQSAGTRHYALAKELMRKGHDVLVISSSFYHKARKEMRLEPGEAFRKSDLFGVPFLWLRTPSYQGSTLRRVWNMAVFAGRLMARQGLKDEPAPDVIIGSSPSLFAAFAAQRLAKRLSACFFFEVRDVWPDTLVELGQISRRHPFIMLLAYLERYLYRHADGILSVLPNLYPHVAAQGVRPEHLFWIPNGVALDTLPEYEPPYSNAKFTLLYAGAHGPYNGLDTVLDAAEILQRAGCADKVRIKLIGDGPNRRQLMAEAVERGLTMVEFCDAVPKTEIYSHLVEADAFLMTMRRMDVQQFGVSPNKLFDYMMAGRPVVYCVSAPKDPVAEVTAGVSVPPDDAEALAGAVKQLVETSAEQRSAMGLRAREYVEQHHTFPVLADRFLDACTEVMNHGVQR